MYLIDLNLLDELFAAVGSRITISVSGGADSMAMLHDIAHARDRWPNKHFTAVYVDHQLHEQSTTWGKHVESACRAWNMPFKAIVVDVHAYGRNLEYAARQARYQALVDRGCDAIVLGHHANDRIESFIMKLMRGSGIKGLKGMTYISDCWINQDIKLLRPMLHINRYAIDAYMQDNHIAYIQDPSNADTRFDRNWIRHVAWPMIQERYPIADININRSLDFLSEAFELTQDLAAIDYNTCANNDGSISWTKAKDLGLVRLKNLIMYVLNTRCNCTSFSTQQVDLFARSLLQASMNSETELRTKTVRLHKLGKRIVVSQLNSTGALS